MVKGHKKRKIDSNAVEDLAKGRQAVENVAANNVKAIHLEDREGKVEQATLNSDAAELKALQRKKRKLIRKEKRKGIVPTDGAKVDLSKPNFLFVPNQMMKHIGMREIRELLLWCFGQGVNPPWISVRNPTLIQRMVMIFVPGLDVSLFGFDVVKFRRQTTPVPFADLVETAVAHDTMPFCRQVFGHLVLTHGPGEKGRIFSPISAIMQCPLSIAEKQKRSQEMTRKQQHYGDRIANYYILTAAQLKDEDYPLPPILSGKPLEPGWVQTEPPAGKDVRECGLDKKKRLIGMDCEMVLTVDGPQVARVSLIGEDGKSLLDELVRPSVPVTDYLTQYSGMTAERLSQTTKNLADIQKDLLRLINFDVILTGHSLHGDLRVLKLVHPYIIDTSILYHHTRGPPYKPSLKWLAEKWLKRTIQNNALAGHDSAEDALASLDLLKLKLKKSPEFGLFQQEQEPLFKRLQRMEPKRRCLVIDTGSGVYNQNADKALRPTDDGNAISQAITEASDFELIWIRLRDMERVYGKEPEWATEQTESKAVPDRLQANGTESEQALSLEDKKGLLRELDKHLRNLYQGLPAGTGLILFSGVGDTRDAVRLTKKAAHCKKAYATIPISQQTEADHWTDADAKALEAAVERGKMGTSMLVVK
ncbi:hypothetical protein BZG36_03415 [Bifiguratus adelaidae]|uniref:Exonuclease domain-containing protein n=1 Tax=Bifiguratus adelaidae TaxID=1938954 RepID=A0A261XYT0_9FUNG|nr:hypothetical protein BZG36_03415 [Bifiguratus adelaidae]